MNDDEIIKNIRAGSHARPVRMLYKYYPVVKKFVVKNSGSVQDAEDLFQDALAIVFNKLKSEKFRLTSSLNTYLFGVCKNLWQEQLRKNKKELKVDFPAKDLPAAEAINFTEQDQQRNKAMQAVLQLGEKCREILQLFYYKNASMAQIAAQLGFASERVAKNQKYRCIEKAREIYLSNQ